MRRIEFCNECIFSKKIIDRSWPNETLYHLFCSLYHNYQIASYEPIYLDVIRPVWCPLEKYRAKEKEEKI